MARKFSYPESVRKTCVKQLESGKSMKYVIERIPKRHGQERVTSRTINNWRKVLKTESHVVKIGRPRTATTKANMTRLICVMTAMGRACSLRHWTAEMNKDASSKISVCSVKKLLKQSKLTCFSRPICKYQSYHPDPKKRLKWAKTFKDMHWDTATFTDEAHFKQWSNSYCGPMWGLKSWGPRIREIVENPEDTIHMTMFMTAGDVPQLFFTERHQTGQLYADLVRRCVPENGTLVQDSDGSHTAHVVRNMCRDQNIRVIPTPVHSGDMNPVENVWNLLKGKVYKGAKVYKSRALLKKSIETHWAKLRTQSKTFFNLVRSMRNRCKAVILRRGGKTKY